MKLLFNYRSRVSDHGHLEIDGRDQTHYSDDLFSHFCLLPFSTFVFTFLSS